MANTDLNAVIRAMVAEEVERSLEPYRNLLERMASVFVEDAPRRRPNARPAVAARRRGRPARAGSKGDASRFQEGQMVRYRQGRGEFEAKIVAIDPDANLVTIERTSDGKRVERPAAKVYEVA